MCDLDADGPDVYREEWRRARKDYRCCACGAHRIKKGDLYHYTFGVWAGEPGQLRHCPQCWAIVEHLTKKYPRENISLTLDCGEKYDEPPDDPGHALAFMSHAEMQEYAEKARTEMKLEEARRRALWAS